MLLPQSLAFVSLRNRLNAVNSAGFLHIAPKSRVFCCPYKTTSSLTRLPIRAAATFSGRSKLNRGEDIKWQELLTHFRSVQLRHEKARRGEESISSALYVDRSEKPSVNGTGPSRPTMRRRVTGEGLPPPGMSPVNVASASSGVARSILSPLNPKRGSNAGGILGFAQQSHSSPRPGTPQQATAAPRTRRTLMGKNGS